MMFTVFTLCDVLDERIFAHIEHIKDQRYLDCELLVIYRDIKDKNVEVSFAEQYPDVKIIEQSDRSLKIYNGFNTAIENASGDYILFLHVGDHFTNSKFLHEIESMILSRPKTNIIYGDIRLLNDAGKIARYWKSSPYKASRLKLGWAPPHTSLIIKKQDFGDILYDCTFRISGDYEYMIRLFKNAKAVSYYTGLCHCQMASGGLSALTLSSLLPIFNEDYSAAKLHFKYPLIAVFGKKIMKLVQFINFSKRLR